MQRSLIVLAVAVLGFVGNAAVAEPSLQMITDDAVRLNAPEATSYQADSNAIRVDEQVFTWNP